MFGFGKKDEAVSYPECETPSSASDVQKLADKKLDALQALIKESGWTNIDFPEASDIKVASKLTGEIHAQMAQGKINAPPKRVAEVAWTTDHSEIKKFDSEISAIKVVQEYSPDLKVYLSVHPLPFPLASREFLAIRSKRVNPDGSIFVWGCSINRSDVPQASGNVRGVISVSGWIIEPADNGNSSTVTRLFRVDPKGNIPTFAINMFKTKAGLGLNAVRNFIKK